MRLLRTVSSMMAWSKREKGNIGFVPTMGAFHEGHRSLMKRARRENRRVVVSIFVNPAQFGPKEDFRRYPRLFKKDILVCRKSEVDVVFAPSVSAMYPPGFDSWIDVPELSKPLCGKFRPGHFRGVSTVVARLLMIVNPQRAYFGCKDFQQLQVVKRLVKDLLIPVQIVSCPTIREFDGLACSSRNRYLTLQQRQEASKLYQALQKGEQVIKSENRLVLAQRHMLTALRKIQGAKIEYVDIVDSKSLQPVRTFRQGKVLLAAAIRFENTRLIDNLVVSVQSTHAVVE